MPYRTEWDITRHRILSVNALGMSPNWTNGGYKAAVKTDELMGIESPNPDPWASGSSRPLLRLIYMVGRYQPIQGKQSGEAPC